MLDFLKGTNISNDTINHIKSNFSKNDIMALSDNRDECLRIISYFENIGIIKIDDLLIYETYIFLKLYNRVIDKLSNYNIKTFIEDVNEDYINIEKYI